MSPPSGMNVSKRSQPSLVTPSSNQCSTFPFLPFFEGQWETSEKDTGHSKEISSSILRCFCCEILLSSNCVSISISTIDPPFQTVWWSRMSPSTWPLFLTIVSMWSPVPTLRLLRNVSCVNQIVGNSVVKKRGLSTVELMLIATIYCVPQHKLHGLSHLTHNNSCSYNY